MPDPSSTQRLASAPGVEVVVSVQSGASAGPPVLLLHGLGQQRSFWDPVVRRLRTRPVATMDQRGHGETGTALDRDYSVAACAADAIAVLDRLGWDTAVVVGHSWGASVALEAAAHGGGRVAAVVLVDGGLWSPSALGPLEEVREALTPPSLGLPADRLWALMRDGDLGPWWSDEVQQALAPTFFTDDDGLVRTRLGVERHMKVLDGLLDYDQSGALDRCERENVPVWAAVCEPSPADDVRAGVPGAGVPSAWQAAKAQGMAAASRRANCLVHRWPGAVHDVPLQWPALVAGLVDAVVEQAEGGDR